MRLFLFPATIFLLAITPAFTQQTQHFQRLEFPVNVLGNNLAYPFAGGMNAPQFSPVDLNNDDKLDLVVFDRAGGVVLTFLNNGNNGQIDYSFEPEYACNFPALSDWALLRDYNLDGAADIFCASAQAGSQEIQVYRGYFDNNVLKFTPFHFSYPNCPTCNPLYIYYPDEIPGNWNNLPIARSDIPALDDIDNDGDLDIVTFPSGATTHAWFFKNTSAETGFGSDSLKFIAASNCWGGFFENGLEACRASLSTSLADCSEGGNNYATNMVADREARHPGATLSTFDLEGDGDKELLLGNISFSCIGMLKNCGNPDQAWFCQQDTSFPTYDSPVNMDLFPATFYLDADNDGKKDILVSPNARTIGEDQKCAWLYKNVSTGPVQQFELGSKTYVVDQMIDMGTATHPAFADVNADGLLDIVVGNQGYFTFDNPNNASLYLFINTGTSDAPAFTLSDNDWLGMTEFLPNDYDFSPTFGDLDGDGDLDLLVGSIGGGLYCYINDAAPGAPMFMVRDLNIMWVSMDVGLASAPAIVDFDGNGLPDVLIGERNGNINYFKNTGTPTEPQFATAPTIQVVGSINMTLPNEAVGFSTPTVVPQPGGNSLLVAGAQGGHLEAYSNGGAAGSFPLVSDHWGGIDEGTRSHPAFADLDGDGTLEMVTGNFRGGLSLYNTVLVDCSVGTNNVHQPATRLGIYAAPNPARDAVQITVSGARGLLSWQVFDALGNLIDSGNSTDAGIRINTANWANGVYFFSVTDTGGKRSGVQRIVVAK